MRDLSSNITVAESVRPSVATGDVTGQEIDLQGCDSCTFVSTIGAIVGGTGDASIIIQESDTSGSGFTAVADADLIGTEATALAANSVQKVGYKGGSRYVRAILDVGTETSVAGSIMCLKGHLSTAPDDASF